MLSTSGDFSERPDGAVAIGLDQIPTSHTGASRERPSRSDSTEKTLDILEAMVQLFTAEQAEEFVEAVEQEIAAQRARIHVDSLSIDAIERLTSTGVQFVYRLTLSNPVHVHPDQVLTFHIRRPAQTVVATVMQADEEGIVVETTQPLPEEASFIRYSFDPSFILRALSSFLHDRQSAPNMFAQAIVSRRIPSLPLPANRPTHLDDEALDSCQRAGAAAMLQEPLHFLWGPPGTGKTQTVGCVARAALARGETVLIASTSNAAVDAASRAMLRGTSSAERAKILRLGSSLDPEVAQITAAGHLGTTKHRAVADALRNRDELDKLLRAISSKPDDSTLLRKRTQLEKQVADSQEKIRSFEQQLKLTLPLVACTLAKLVLDQDLQSRRFDFVIVDEASMVSLPFAIAAALMARERLVFAGDWQQLPPICQSNQEPATDWFGRNIYHWLGVEEQARHGHIPPYVSFLANQYRMTPIIADLVSVLSYGNRLNTCRAGFTETYRGADVFMIPVENGRSYYSVAERSYFNPCSLPIIHGLVSAADPRGVLLLTPFRPQRSLLSALCADMRQVNADLRVSASTIHRSQGTECRCVIVDLTTHNPDKLASFFRDRDSEKLINVALSRARDELFLIGNPRMLQALSGESNFWREFVKQVGGHVQVMTAEEAQGELEHFPAGSVVPWPQGHPGAPALYSHGDSSEPVEQYASVLGTVTASRKLLVADKPCTLTISHDAIVRSDAKSRDLPRLFALGGKLFLPHNGGWIALPSPNTCRVLWRIGFSHLADDEADPAQASRFFCPECTTGNLVIHSFKGEGWYLICTNLQAHTCNYRRRLSLEDAKLKVRLTNMRCPDKHPLTVRTSAKGLFLACENYPAHEYSESLSILAGT